MRDRLSIITASACGIFLVIQYFVSVDWMDHSYGLLLSWMQIIFASALVAGVFAVMKSHWSRAKYQRSERFNVAVLIGSAVTMTIFGLAGGIGQGSAFQWVFDHLQAPMQATVFSLLAFYVTSAAYRGFRARRTESFVLVAAAVIVLPGRLPLGEVFLPALPGWADWILYTPALAAKRAILIGIGLGMAATSLKVIAGVERTYLGGR